MKSLLNPYVVNILSALTITFIFFIWNDYFHATSKLDDHWEVEYTVKESDYNKYKEMKIYANLYLFQIGNKVFRTGEKIAEQVKYKNKTFYNSKAIVRMNVDGVIKNNFIKLDQLILHIVEKGKERTITSLIKLDIKKSNILRGSFFSSASNSRGNAVYRRVKD